MIVCGLLLPMAVWRVSLFGQMCETFIGNATFVSRRFAQEFSLISNVFLSQFMILGEMRPQEHLGLKRSYLENEC